MVEQKEVIKPEGVEVPKVPEAEEKVITPPEIPKAERIQPILSLEELEKEIRGRWAEVLGRGERKEGEEKVEAVGTSILPGPEKLNRLEDLLKRPDLSSPEGAAELEEEILNLRG